MLSPPDNLIIYHMHSVHRHILLACTGFLSETVPSWDMDSKSLRQIKKWDSFGSGFTNGQ